MKAQCADCDKPLAQVDWVRRREPGSFLSTQVPLCEPCWRKQDIEATAREGKKEGEMLPLKVRILEWIDRRLGHRVRLLCRICAYWNYLSWEEAGEVVRMYDD